MAGWRSARFIRTSTRSSSSSVSGGWSASTRVNRTPWKTWNKSAWLPSRRLRLRVLDDCSLIASGGDDHLVIGQTELSANALGQLLSAFRVFHDRENGRSPGTLPHSARPPFPNQFDDRGHTRAGVWPALRRCEHLARTSVELVEGIAERR